MRTLIRGGRVVDPSQGLDTFVDVLIEDGEVARLEERLAAPEHAEVVDATGLVVAPGFIYLHAHI